MKMETKKEVFAENLYRILYFCPSCHTELGHTTHNLERCFGMGSVLKNNCIPKCCLGVS